MVTETHRKLIDNFYKLEAENKRLREALTKISEGDRFDLYQLMSNPAQNAEAYRLINIAKEALLNVQGDKNV
tara:strand:+ start:11487 stop:11702 length:216 start_codon:yes stop_codon:yes gene_type:complete